MALEQRSIVLDTLGKLAAHGHGIFGHCFICRRQFDVSMQKLIVERGADCYVSDMHPLRCPSCEGFRTEFRITTPSRPWGQAFGFDPPSGQVLAFLAKLKPCEELVMRMALRRISAHCRADREWQRRLNELMAEVRPSAAQFARLLRQTAMTVDAIEAAITGSEAQGCAAAFSMVS